MVPMYIESVPNRNSPPAILLRESYREAGKVRKRTLANLSQWPSKIVEGLRALLKGGHVVSDLSEAFQVLAIIGKRIFLDFRRPATGHANLVSGVGSAEMDRSSG